MAFLARENREISQPQTNKAFGRGLFANQDINQLEKKNQAQLLYKQELQRQMKEKQQRINKQKELIRRQQQKLQRQIQQINRKQQANNNRNKSPQNNGQAGFNPVYDNHQNYAPRELQVKVQPKIPEKNKRIGSQVSYEQKPIPIQQPLLPRKTTYLPPQLDATHQYYEERMIRHKQDLDRKLDQLFHHIHSSQDNIKVNDELQKIKMRLRGKISVERDGLREINESGFYNRNDHNMEEYSKFYKIPKKNSYESPKHSRIKKLDYQSSSAFRQQPVYQSRFKLNIGQDEEQTDNRVKYSSQSKYRTKWGKKPNKDKFLSDRDALDYQINKMMSSIDQVQKRLGSGV